jgi:hypothetical protein
MSATTTETVPTAPAGMTIIQKLEAFGHKCLTAAEHGAAWLVGMAATGSADLNALEKDSPLVGEAVQFGIAAAQAHGVPVGAIEDAGADVLAAAKQLAAGLAAPAPVAVPVSPSAGA